MIDRGRLLLLLMVIKWMVFGAAVFCGAFLCCIYVDFLPVSTCPPPLVVLWYYVYCVRIIQKIESLLITYTVQNRHTSTYDEENYFWLLSSDSIS